MSFEDMALKILAFPGRSVGEGVEDDQIEQASQALRVPIRGGYRQLLKRFGWAGFADLELYGLGRDIAAYLQLVDITRSERTEMFPPLPEHLLPIMNDGGGNLVCLDTRASPDEPPVVMWYHDDPDGPEQVPAPQAPDFLSWLAKALAET